MMHPTRESNLEAPVSMMYLPASLASCEITPLHQLLTQKFQFFI